MVYNELEQGNILSEVRVGLASLAYPDISLRSIWAIYKIRQTPIPIMDVLRKRIRSFPKKLRDHALGQWPEELPSLLPTLCSTLYNVPECYDFPFSPTVRS